MKKLKKCSLDELEKCVQTIGRYEQRQYIAGGAIGDWLRNLWWDVVNVLGGRRDCAFNTFQYVYNNNIGSEIIPPGEQIGYRELVNGYLDEHGFPSSGGVPIGDFMKYVNSHYWVHMYQMQGGSISSFSSTNIIAIPGGGQSLHFVVPLEIIKDANGNPERIKYYDPTYKEEKEIPVSALQGIFDITYPYIDDLDNRPPPSPFDLNYPYYMLHNNSYL
jgi:hypothetical protein